MPTWVVGILQWAVGLALQHISAADVKKMLATVFVELDQAVQAVDARVTGPFKGVADEVALAFHDACTAVVDALRK